jgi:hypothetical protein
VDDHRQADLAGQAHLAPEHLALDRPRRMVVVEVEADLADLADRDDPLLASQALQLVVDPLVGQARFMRMHTGRRRKAQASAVRIARRCPASSSTPPTISICSTPASPRPGHNLGAVRVELWHVDVRM